MKIKTSLQLSALFLIVMSIIASLGMVLRSLQLSAFRGNRERSETVVRETSEFCIETSGLLVYRNETRVKGWRANLDSLVKLLGSIDSDNASEMMVVDRMEKKLLALQKSSLEISGKKQSAQDLSLLKQAEGETGALLSDAFKLSRIANTQRGVAEENADIIFSVFIAIIGLSMAVLTLALNRDVLKRIGMLGAWARKVSGKGDDKDEKVHLPGGDDEIGELARAVSHLIGLPKGADPASEKTIADFRKTEAALRDTNMRLSDALTRLKRAQTQIIQQERFRALEQVVRGVAHDFNNTLTPILGTSDLILMYPEDLDDKDRVKDYISTINEAAKAARKSVVNLAEFFRSSKGTTTGSFELVPLVEEVLALVRPKLKDRQEETGGSISIDLQSSKVPLVGGHKIDLREILIEIIVNAIESFDGDGSITIKIRPESDFVVLNVIDNGIGMSDEVRQRCTEPFYSTKGVEGVGMGLTIATVVAQRCGGKLTVESEEGEGVTVTICLPVWTGVSEKEEVPEEPEKEVTRKLKVLIVDDELWSREMVKRFLTVLGHEFEVAVNGTEGLEKAKNGKYDLVITDMAMPDISGDVVAAQIRDMFPEIHIIMLTGFGDIMREEGSQPDGVDVVLSKPVTATELRKAIAKVVC